MVAIHNRPASSQVPEGTWLLANKIAAQVLDCSGLLCGRIVQLLRPRSPDGQLISTTATPARGYRGAPNLRPHRNPDPRSAGSTPGALRVTNPVSLRCTARSASPANTACIADPAPLVMACQVRHREPLVPALDTPRSKRQFPLTIPSASVSASISPRGAQGSCEIGIPIDFAILHYDRVGMKTTVAPFAIQIWIHSDLLS
jgi:hypothetical protein